MNASKAFSAIAVTADDISKRIDRLPFHPYHWRMAGILVTGTLSTHSIR
jgi:hypothetical protein